MEKQILAQILNGTIDPGWVIAILMAVCIMLLARVLNRIEKRLENHDDELKDHSKKITVIETELKIK